MSPGKVRVVVLLNITGDAAAAAADVGVVDCGLFVSNDHDVCLLVAGCWLVGWLVCRLVCRLVCL